MEQKLLTNNERRLTALRNLLTHLRTVELARVKEFRRDQSEATLTVPADDLDFARAQTDVEMHASLIERSEDRLRAIAAAFDRLERGTYGLCDLCGNEIPLERLSLLPFANFCVDCQQTHESRHPGEVGEPFIRRWTLPLEMDESLDQPDTLARPEDRLYIHGGGAFGPEEGELKEATAVRAPRQRRPRKAAAKKT